MRSPAEARRLARHADRLVISGSATLIAGGLAWGVSRGAKVPPP